MCPRRIDVLAGSLERQRIGKWQNFVRERLGVGTPPHYCRFAQLQLYADIQPYVSHMCPRSPRVSVLPHSHTPTSLVREIAVALKIKTSVIDKNFKQFGIYKLSLDSGSE